MKSLSEIAEEVKNGNLEHAQGFAQTMLEEGETVVTICKGIFSDFPSVSEIMLHVGVAIYVGRLHSSEKIQKLKEIMKDRIHCAALAEDLQNKKLFEMLLGELNDIS
jgi:predicted TIM-barrel fold metal-dependent hydrolase